MTWVINKQSSNKTIKGHQPLVGLLLQLSQLHAKKRQCSTILPELLTSGTFYNLTEITKEETCSFHRLMMLPESSALWESSGSFWSSVAGW